MGHYHVQLDKVDPGPAFDFEKIRAGAWALMSPEARSANLAARGKPVRFVEVPTTQPSSASYRRKRQPLRPTTWPMTQVSNAR